MDADILVALTVGWLVGWVHSSAALVESAPQWEAASRSAVQNEKAGFPRP